MSILSHALGFSTFRKTLQKHIVERLLFASTRCCGGGFLKRPAACWLFLPPICRVAILPRSRRMGSVNRQVCSSSPWKFPGMSVVQPIPMVHKSMVCSSTPPISFVLAPLWLFRYVRCPILLGSEPEKYQVPSFREATSINCSSVDLFSPLDFSYHLLPY